MDGLEDTLTEVRQRVARYKDRAINEQNTKATLIVPVLRALGWDVEDLEEVQLEYKERSADNPVDYALFILGKVRLFVEAKALGGNLDDRRWANQIMGYASVAGVEWVVLTDGNEYRIYNAHAMVPVAEKLFRTTRITDAGPHVVETLGLLSKEQMSKDLIRVLWEAYFIDRQIRTAVEDIFFPEADPGLIRLIRNRVPRLTPAEVKAGLTRVGIRLDFPVAPPPPSMAPIAHPTPSPNDSPDEPTLSPGNSSPQGIVTLADLIAEGILKPPLQLEKMYKGHHFTALVTADGKVTWQGEVCDSVSTAAGVARRSIIGNPPGRTMPQTNGWVFWQFRDTDGQMKNVDVLRQRYLTNRLDVPV